MSLLEQVQTGVDYIEAHLDEELALCAVARKAGISQWHFQRIFKALTGETLKTYIRSRRLAQSLEQLLGTERRIIEVALEAGFESQAAFTRAFKSAFGLTPNQYRKIGRRSLFLKKVQFNSEYLSHINRQLSLEPVVYEQPRMTVVGLTTQFYGVDSDKNNVGAQLPPLWAAFLPRLGTVSHAVPGTCYGIVKPSEEDPEVLSYCAGIAVTHQGPLPRGMQAVTVPAATYAKFTHNGNARQIDHTVNYAYSTWLAQSERRHTYGPDLEMYGSAYHPTSTESVMHYAIPVSAMDAQAEPVGAVDAHQRR